MKIHDVTQGSMEWLMARAAIPTASEFGNLITPLGKIRTGQTPKAYLAKKLSEWWTGMPLFTAGFWNGDQGHILEREAIPGYEFEYNQPITRVGFITTDDDRIGCSPDGLIGDNCGIEVKCPEAPTHVSYLLAGKLPDDYVAQVQGSMLVTGFSQWKFMSYRRGFPNLVLTIERDEKFAYNLNCALDFFLRDFDAGQKRLVEINGGPPVWPESDDSPHPNYHIEVPEESYEDVTP